MRVALWLRLQPSPSLPPRVLEVYISCTFFFQAEDGIRDVAVTGVQTCALPICCRVSTQGGGKRAPSKGTFALNSSARLLIYLQHRCWKVEGSSRPLELRHRITSTDRKSVV